MKSFIDYLVVGLLFLAVIFVFVFAILFKFAIVTLVMWVIFGTLALISTAFAGWLTSIGLTSLTFSAVIAAFIIVVKSIFNRNDNDNNKAYELYKYLKKILIVEINNSKGGLLRPLF